MENFETYVSQILEWGRQNISKRTGIATDFDGHFSPAFTEYVRRELRSQAIDDTTGKLTGSWRKGYALRTETGERIGVTGGYGKFRIFYDPAGVTK